MFERGEKTMSSILIVLSTWLHTLATIIMVGYYIFTGLIFLPVLERQMPANTLRDLLEQVSARLRPYFGGALLIFLVTGTYLMMINEEYLGLGHFFANPWSSLIVIKHFVVLVFLALAFYSERAFLAKIGDQNPRALKQFRQALNINTALGMLIILMTSIAQAA
jgi:uncharacterized membrane protein